MPFRGKWAGREVDGQEERQVWVQVPKYLPSTFLQCKHMVTPFGNVLGQTESGSRDTTAEVSMMRSCGQLSVEPDQPGTRNVLTYFLSLSCASLRASLREAGGKRTGHYITIS